MKTVLPLLSERMKHLLNMVSEAESVADIGCDHGYVAIRLIESGKARHVIASDIHEGPLERAREHIREFGLTDRIETRISDGFAAYAPGEAQGAVMAGMGGRLISSILEKDPAPVRSLREFILQPQSEISFVRAWLRGHGFLIAAEDMVAEDGKFYPMMRVVPEKERNLPKPGAGDSSGAAPESNAGDSDGAGAHREGRSLEELQRIEDRYGPCLLAARHPVLLQYLKKERGTYEEILRSLDGVSEKQRMRRAEIGQRLRELSLAENVMGIRQELS